MPTDESAKLGYSPSRAKERITGSLVLPSGTPLDEIARMTAWSKAVVGECQLSTSCGHDTSFNRPVAARCTNRETREPSTYRRNKCCWSSVVLMAAFDP